MSFMLPYVCIFYIIFMFVFVDFLKLRLFWKIKNCSISVFYAGIGTYQSTLARQSTSQDKLYSAAETVKTKQNKNAKMKFKKTYQY